MKKLILSVSALALSAAPFTAGTLTEPVIEEVEPVMEDKSSSSSGILVPLLILGVVAALIASGGDDEEEAPPQTSDVRLKRDIKLVGKADNGLDIYSYKYLWSNKTYEGVMAQDVLEHTPEAVKTGLFGVMLVDYSKLGMEMRQIH